MFRTCAVVVLGLAAACAPNYDHDPCEWTGSGFTAKHDCPLTLMCLNSFQCPDGQYVPNYEACSGPRCSVDADCRGDHFCYAYSDAQSYCMPLDECTTEEEMTWTTGGVGAVETVTTTAP